MPDEFAIYLGGTRSVAIYRAETAEQAMTAFLSDRALAFAKLALSTAQAVREEPTGDGIARALMPGLVEARPVPERVLRGSFSGEHPKTGEMTGGTY